MRALPFFVLLGVSLLLGFTFYDDVPGRVGPRSYEEADRLIPVAYAAAMAAVEARLGPGHEPAFPTGLDRMRGVRVYPNGHVEIESWVTARGEGRIAYKTPFSAQLQCYERGCIVERVRLQR